MGCWEHWDFVKSNILLLYCTLLALPCSLKFFQIWMCGGSLEVMPCSRVGHIFRYARPYGSPNNTDTASINSMRTVAVWFDEYQEKFYSKKPWLEGRAYGDVTERVELRKKLNCSNFDWYINNVFPELKSLWISSESIFCSVQCFVNP